MKNTIIVVIVLVLIVLGVVFYVGKDKAEAPVTENTEMEGMEDTSMPVPAPAPTPSSANTPTVGTYTAPVKEFTVTGKNYFFSPSLITVKKGDRVRITFKNDEGFHDFKIASYGVATKQFAAPSTEVIEFTADKAGDFEFFCSVGTHRAMGMKGTLVVQ